MATPGNVSQRIKAFNSRLFRNAVQIKYKLMSQGTFGFYRGTCHLFYEDLNKVPLAIDSPNVWMSGDLHLENFGSYKGDNRLVYFDLNDFDESILGPASWELLRIVTSIFVAFESLKIEEEEAFIYAEQFVKVYSMLLANGKARYIELWTARGIVRSFLDQVSRRKQSILLKKHLEEGKLRFRIDDEKHFKLNKAFKRELMEHIYAWVMNNRASPYKCRVLDVCFRVAGTGSLGVKRYVFLLQGISDKKAYWFLDMKQSLSSSLLPYIKVAQPPWESEATRAISIKTRVQNISPALLGTTIFKEDSYVLQEMQPMEDKIDFNLIKDRYKDVFEVINDMALLTASGQLRSSGRQGSAIADELIYFGQSNAWQKEVLQYARNYARQVKADYREYADDYKKGFFNEPG